ncbi:hypothetical protein D7S89_26960 [Trinickia fusca]|uniref:Uncharacterized protein n=1 Tax=Trinickia fusca TaxID=2419777 RepID=A0A494WXI5_9BURK|nr:hypothetical protein D7S89_26960 [Trinickia fusca]
MTEYFEYADDGKTITKADTSVFDADNRLMRDTQVLSPTGQPSHTVTVTYDYRLADGHGNYTGADQGVVTHTQQRDTANPSVIDTATSYVWWDQAEQSKIQVRGSDPTNPNISIFGFKGSAYGWKLVWCNSCNSGLRISRTKVPENTQILIEESD